MNFINSLFGSNKVDTQAVVNLGKQVQGTFSSVKESGRQVLKQRTYEIKELPDVLRLLEGKGSVGNETLHQMVDTANNLFVKQKVLFENMTINQGGYLAKDTIIPQREVQIQILSKMGEFAHANQDLILQVKALKKNSPQDYKEALEDLNKNARKEVAIAVDLLADLNMNGVVSNSSSEIQISAQDLEKDPVKEDEKEFKFSSLFNSESKVSVFDSIKNEDL